MLPPYLEGRLEDWQEERLKDVMRGHDAIALYWDMGLGKTWAGTEAAVRYGDPKVLIICQKSKIEDWVHHTHGTNLTSPGSIDRYLTDGERWGVINYDMVWRRPVLASLRGFTLILDESSMIQNESSKRTRFILKLNPSHVVLLSGTPTGGRYEKLWSQMKLLGWGIRKGEYWDRFVQYRIDTRQGFPLKIVTGYRNIPELKQEMRSRGASFLRSEEILDLPEQRTQTVTVENTKEYRVFERDSIVKVEEKEIVGDTALTQLLGERMLASGYNPNKASALRDILDSTDERIVVFYNFNSERDAILEASKGRRVSEVSGHTKDLTAYESDESSVTMVQYQSGAMGLNLQKARITVFYSPPLISELYEQAKKRTHRIGQNRMCLYYVLETVGSVEEHIHEVLDRRRDYTLELFSALHGT